MESERHATHDIVIDIDTTDIELHGGQEGSFLSRLLRRILLPALYISCGEHRLVVRLRSANIDAAAGKITLRRSIISP